jgi:hypothetical protein
LEPNNELTMAACIFERPSGAPLTHQLTTTTKTHTTMAMKVQGGRMVPDAPVNFDARSIVMGNKAR